MWYDELFKELIANKNTENAIPMSKYMRNQFAFLGVQTPVRRQISAKYFKKFCKETSVDWNFANKCYEKPEREFQYVAVNYLEFVKEKLNFDDISKIKKLITTKSWWDTIDVLDKIIGYIAFKYSEVNNILLEWSLDENIWLRRVAIDHQLIRKEKTDTNLLERIIKNNFGSNEFFINKAIGWSLRQYSKTNPKWVADFIEKYKDKMASLSIREASKYI